MKFKCLIIIFILLLSANNISATQVFKNYDTHGYGTWTYDYTDLPEHIEMYYHANGQEGIYIKATVCSTGGEYSKLQLYKITSSGGLGILECQQTQITIYATVCKSCSYQITSPYIRIRANGMRDGGTSSSGTLYLTASDSPIVDYTISGNFTCIDDIEIYSIDGSGAGTLLDTDTSSPYTFDIIDTLDYRLVYSDGFQYNFTCDGNKIYDRDACVYTTLNFRDNCNNLIPETTGYWYTPDEFLPQSFYASSGSCDIPYEGSDYLELWVMSHIGELYYNITNPEDITYSVNNPTISWNNNIFVKDLNNSIIIEDALVTFSQDCIIDDSLYPSRNKYTNIDGYAIFEQCELDMSYINVTKDGYKSFSGSISPINLNALKSGQTTIVNLYPVDDELNESDYTSTNYNTYIYFKDVDGSITNSILDTDDYVDLYYYNNNSAGVSMILQFYKTNIYTGKTGLVSWNIPYEGEGYKRILKSNYTQTNYGYYGYLYSYSIDGWNTKKRLTVSNNTIEVINHYQNLTKNVWFINKDGNDSIDYRNEIKIVAYAKSNYSFLYDITLKLYDNSVLIESIILNVFDFTTADIENYYEWNLGYNYTKDHNYTIEMYGYDDTFLKLDYINAIDLRKNKLTIIVKDRCGDTLINSYIFLEGYPSLTTGNNYYNSYENLDNGNYRYKATKSGYTSGGWDNINIIDSDNTVVYILSYDSGSSPLTQTKLSDNDLQKMFVSLMTILIIFILLGGLSYVAK